MQIHRMSIAALLATVALAVMAAPALSHVKIKSTKPSRGGTSSTSIRTATVTFNGPLRSGTLRISGPGGKVSIGSGARDPRNVTRLRVSLKGSKRAGRYRARWTVTAADGHKQRGSFRFRLRRR
jgi:methionine-rich copper-binding protein CopC